VEEQLHGMQDNDVQGDHARCKRSCNAAAAGGPAQEAVESRVENVGIIEKETADEVKRHCGLLAEDMEMAPV
jgi:hypothetical protein